MLQMPRSKVTAVQFIISIFCDRWNTGTSYKITSSCEPYHFPRLSSPPLFIILLFFPPSSCSYHSTRPFSSAYLTFFFISVFIFVSVSPAHLFLPPLPSCLALTLLLFSFSHTITSRYLFVSSILRSLPHTLPRHFPHSAVPCVGSVYLPADN